MSTFKYMPQYFSTTLNVGGGIDASQTTGIVLLSVSGVDITKPGQICISYSDPLDTGVAEWINYTSINGSNELVGVTRGCEGYSAHSHPPGATIQFTLSATHLNDLVDVVNGIKAKDLITTGGGTTTYTLTPTPAVGAYVTGQEFKIKINVTNTGPSTINISGLGAKAITKTGAVALAAGELMIDAIYTITYDGTQFQLAGGAGGGGGGTNSFVTTETPSGTINGSNVTFTLANTPVAGTLQIARDGQALYETNDWTLSGATVTMVSAPVTGSVLRASYQITTGTSGNADTLDTFHAAAQPTANMIPVHNASGVLVSPIYAPQGFLQNGKLVITVASNNITVALKTLAGTDATAANPIVVRIGDAVRLITAALSVTKNAGTNWCNAGSAELATKEVDYFVYLGYNATDGVVIGFSRIPYATKYGDFSATTTAETYCAISTITTAAATDYYEVIGRFAATLSAGAGYTWSVPTFTAANLIQRPIYETRWLAFATTFTGFSSAPSGDTNSYKIANRTAYATRRRSTSGTSNSTSFTQVLPMSSVGADIVRSVLPFVQDSGSVASTPGGMYVANASTTLTFEKTINNSASWTSSGTKDCEYSIFYAI